MGIETTAHTLSFGLVDADGIPYPAASDTLRPDQGGIHPREAADHHKDVAAGLFSEVLEKHGLDLSDISAVAYSQGPGLGPCLRVGAAVARGLATRMDVPLIGVNHCVAHIEIGRQQCGCDDPVLLYVSGGNTQVIARLNGRYRVLGETLDIGIGNMLDKFARNQGIPFPGGPKIEQLAKEYLAENPNPDMEGLQLPYAVRGMDLAFSGLLTAAQRLIDNGMPLNAVCWSLQEHALHRAWRWQNVQWLTPVNRSCSSAVAWPVISAFGRCARKCRTTEKANPLHHHECIALTTGP